MTAAMIAAMLLTFLWAAADLPSDQPTEPDAVAQAPRVRGEKGLWIGSMSLCRDNVAVRAVADPTGEPALLLTFSPDLQPRLRDETAGQLDRPMAIRVGGRTLTAPYVREPIAGLEMQLAGLDSKARKAIARAAERRC